MGNSSGKGGNFKRDKRDEGTGHAPTIQADGRTAIPDDSTKMPEPRPKKPKDLPDPALGSSQSGHE
ncbi:hypothetical protein DPMN_059193 [Dreissena polymorpha]|uniref:Uncharacterized protein n=1 Tax=Dreissena polymorpha TaxID=45954 RepID=A0A9D4C3E5_DREPO|nr:hypothetical protein DPMN_059193 [Dreissena polymorpha]